VTASPRLSVVIPAFNEATRLPSYLEAVVGFREGQGEHWEVVVVDDGSTDGTAKVARAVAARHPQARLLPLGRNRGKGAAVRAGMLAATGAARLFTAEAAETLSDALETGGFAFHVELLLRAEARGYRVVEVPVNRVDQEGGKVGVLANGPGMVVQILRARWRMRRR
jgi:glycosyltransferase involved in cell wall biosynthesis